MELKKNRKVNLENKRMLFFQFGLIISLSIALLAFEWGSQDKGAGLLTDSNNDNSTKIEEIIIQTKPKPKIQNQKVIPLISMLEIVKDDYKNENDPDWEIWDPTFDPDPDLSKYVLPEKDTIEDPVKPFSVQPKFPGGDEALFHFLKSNIVYPREALLSGISGTVAVKFIVEKDGSITHIEVFRSVAGGCDQEALRVVKLMPKWERGYRNGKPARGYFKLPIQFKLEK